MGGSLGYISGVVNDLSDDMKELKPTIFPVVPRLLNRFNDTIKVGVFIFDGNKIFTQKFHFLVEFLESSRKEFPTRTTRLQACLSTKAVQVAQRRFCSKSLGQNCVQECAESVGRTSAGDCHRLGAD